MRGGEIIPRGYLNPYCPKCQTKMRVTGRGYLLCHECNEIYTHIERLIWVDGRNPQLKDIKEREQICMKT